MSTTTTPAAIDELRDFIEMEGPDGPRLPQLPALDGLRGLAVAGVVLYHAGFDVMVGGFLGVSTFFTLSGFLITMLLLDESRRSGTVALRRFWARRFRRLMPATLVTLALVAVVFGLFVASPSQRLELRGDVLSSLFEVANWYFVIQGSSYGDLFAEPSPVLHFWSLAIEEQFYWVFPLLVLGFWRLTKGRRGQLGVGVAVLALASAALPLVFTMSQDRIYFGTDTRAAELLVGSVLAVVLSYRPVRRKLSVRVWWRTALLVVAGACAAVQLFWWWSVRQDSDWLYRGGFSLYAVMTCVIITACAVPFGPFRRAVALAPLRWLGTRSFAIYLFHWPLFLAARQLAPGVPRTSQAIAVIAVSLALAEASFHLLERPIRAGRWPSPRWAPRALVGGFGVVAVLAFVPLPVDESEVPIDFEAALEEFEQRPRPQLTTSTTTTTIETPTTIEAPTDDPDPTTTTAPPSAPPVASVATFGDSVGLLAAMGLAGYSLDAPSPRLLDSGGDTVLGCGISRFDQLRVDSIVTPTAECRGWPDRWPGRLDALNPDIAMVVTGAWEVPDARLPGSSQWSAVGDPAVDEFVRSELNLAVDSLAREQTMVLLVLWPPYAEWATLGTTAAFDRQSDPARMLRLHELMREIAAARPDQVRLLDMGAWLGPERLADRSLRRDGLHIEPESMQQLWTQGLSDEVHGIWEQWWLARQSAG